MADKPKRTERDKRREHLQLLVGLGVVGLATLVVAARGETAVAGLLGVAGVRGVVLLVRGWPNRSPPA
ncbi:MAG: hypothetical protein U0804_05000 [Gemmataceae bacterium]